jgi:type II secretory pathway pseudopilin PulG
MMFINRLRDDQRGFALEATLMVMLLISVLLAAAVLGAVTTTRTTSMDYRNSRVFYAAEAATEAIMGQLGQDMEDGYLSDEELAALVPPPLQGFSFDSFSVTKVDDAVVETITDGSFAGLYALTQKVEIYSEARDAVDNSSAILISAKAQAIPIFQFGVFFEKDLEATNGPSMTFSGWVHANGNIYLSSNNAWYKDAITTPNQVYHDRKDNHSIMDGVYIDDAYGNEVKLLFDSRTHADPNSFRARSDQDFDNRLKTDAYAVDSLKVPLPAGVGAEEVMRPREAGDTDEEKRAKFAWKADMYVVVDLVNLTQRQAVCGSSASKTPDEVIGDPGVVGLQPVEAGVQITFKIGKDCGWKSGADFDVQIFGDGALMWTGSENDVGTLCTFNVTIPFGTDELKVVITDHGGSPYDGTATWKNLQSLLDGTTPWPNITVTRPAGMVVPDIKDLCDILQWEWSAFYDGREQSMSDIMNVNVAGLSLWSAGKSDRASEILYVEIQAPADVGAYSGAAKALLDDNTLDPAVRVINASILPNRMSIATDWPLYVRGDYNSLAWKPSALVGDAITIQSTAWIDADHKVQVIEKKNATETEMWAAILAGHSATPCDHEVAPCPGGYTDFYGGGIENFPRFLERWSGVKFIYRGSLVSLDVAQRAIGTWNGSYYSPPVRDWQFDTRFEDPSNLPPGTPVVGVVIRTAFRPVF